MQTNALSRQVALLAEPKTPLESSVFYKQWLFCTHHGSTAMRLHYTLLTLPLHMRVQVYCTREITSVYRNAENEPVSRIKMADYSELVSMGTL